MVHDQLGKEAGWRTFLSLQFNATWWTDGQFMNHACPVMFRSLESHTSLRLRNIDAESMIAVVRITQPTPRLGWAQPHTHVQSMIRNHRNTAVAWVCLVTVKWVKTYCSMFWFYLLCFSFIWQIVFNRWLIRFKTFVSQSTIKLYN
jgi:hypothetical protein